MMVGTICRRGDRQVGRVDIHVKLDMTAARTLSWRHSVVRKAAPIRGRAVGHSRLYPRHGCYRRPRSASALRARPHGPWLTLAA